MPDQVISIEKMRVYKECESLLALYKARVKTATQAEFSRLADEWAKERGMDRIHPLTIAKGVMLADRALELIQPGNHDRPKVEEYHKNMQVLKQAYLAGEL